jgi:hypothetical protein
MKHLLLLLTMSVALMVNGQISVLPYEQPFDDTTIPAFWTQLDHQGNDQIWQFGTDESTGEVWYPSPILDGNYAIVNSDAYGDGGVQNVDLISPTFDLSAYSSVNLKFTHFFYDYDISAATLSYSIDDGANWSEIKKWEESSSNPEIFNQVIAAVGLESQVKFKWNYVGEYGWGWAIDDIVVSEVTLIEWTGEANTDWNNPANWSSLTVPGSNSEVNIPASALIYPVVLQIPAAECLKLTIESGATLTINSGLSLSVYDELINNSSNGLIIKSDGGNGTGSVIAGSVTGSGTAEIDRYMTENLWHYVGSPVEQPISSFLANNTDIPTKNIDSRGMMDYNTELDNWNDFFTNSNGDDLGVGRGYSIRTTSNTHVIFNGPITAGTINIPLAVTGNRWNLIGNPYTSSIKLNYYSGTNNFLSNNENVLEPSYVSIYYWDGTQYQIINNVQGPEFATVCQGFFVKSEAGGGDVVFTPEMQIHQPTVSLKSAVVIPGIKLLASSSSKNASTDIKFHKKGTTGLDKGYDAGIFKSDPTFAVFTKLVDDNNVNFGLQCLPELSAKTMIIPVGIDFPAGGDVTISAQLLSFPEESNIILEDRLLNTNTSFKDVNSRYTATIAANSMPTGRFYLHVSGNEQVTGIQESVDKRINAWMERDEIVIYGVSENNAVAKLFDIRGGSVLVKNLDKTVTNRINVNGITSGIYMLQVVENGKRTGIKLQINGK